jgi:hypothetical protein
MERDPSRQELAGFIRKTKRRTLLQFRRWTSDFSRLLKNAHLRRCPHPSSLRRTSKYASLLPWSGLIDRISGALHLGIFEQPAKNNFSSNLLDIRLLIGKN